MDRVERIVFNAQRAFLVGKPQPVAVHVYDYYNPSKYLAYNPSTYLAYNP